MSLKPRLQTFLKYAEEGKQDRRKKLDEVMHRLGQFSDTSHSVEAELVRLILKETIGRDEETLVLIRVIVEVSGYIDTLQDTMNALEKRLQKVDSTKSKVRKIEKLAKKHDEVYRALDEILKQRVKTADEETAYVQ
jgi:hypothetical protein